MFYRVIFSKNGPHILVRRRIRRAYRVRRRKPRKAPNRPDYVARKETARILAEERLRHFSAQYAALPAPLGPELALAMQWKRLAIRNTRSRWGSCSSRKNLNFNYRILDLPPELRDYVIVHELCHLKELNHGRRFWDLMELMVPQARQFHAEARSMRIS